jgi:hypothetical protein
LHCTVDGADRSLAIQKQERNSWLAGEASDRDDPWIVSKAAITHTVGGSFNLSLGVAG